MMYKAISVVLVLVFITNIFPLQSYAHEEESLLFNNDIDTHNEKEIESKEDNSTYEDSEQNVSVDDENGLEIEFLEQDFIIHSITDTNVALTDINVSNADELAYFLTYNENSSVILNITNSFTYNNYSYSESLYFGTKSGVPIDITINLCGNTLTVGEGSYTTQNIIEIRDGATLTVNGPGTLDVIGGFCGIFSYGIGSVFESSDGAVVTVSAVGTASRAVSTSGDGTIIISGNVDAYDYGVITSGGGTVYIDGNITAGVGINAMESSIVTITGNVYGSSYAAMSSASEIIIGGNSVATGDYGYGAYATYGSTITINGDASSIGATNYGAGAYADTDSLIIVNGNVTATGRYSYGAYANNNSTTVVKGNASGYYGAFSGEKGKVYVFGIISGSYIDIHVYDKSLSSNAPTRTRVRLPSPYDEYLWYEYKGGDYIDYDGWYIEPSYVYQAQGFVPDYLYGDVNGDGRVNGTDVQALILWINAGSPENGLKNIDAAKLTSENENPSSSDVQALVIWINKGGRPTEGYIWN